MTGVNAGVMVHPTVKFVWQHLEYSNTKPEPHCASFAATCCCSSRLYADNYTNELYGTSANNVNACSNEFRNNKGWVTFCCSGWLR